MNAKVIGHSNNCILLTDPAKKKSVLMSKNQVYLTPANIIEIFLFNSGPAQDFKQFYTV